jgi:hypothetical protein
MDGFPEDSWTGKGRRRPGLSRFTASSTAKLLEGATTCLLRHGVVDEDMDVAHGRGARRYRPWLPTAPFR